MKKLPVASDLAVAEAKTAVQQQPPMVKKQPRRPMTSRYRTRARGLCRCGTYAMKTLSQWPATSRRRRPGQDGGAKKERVKTLFIISKCDGKVVLHAPQPWGMQQQPPAAKKERPRRPATSQRLSQRAPPVWLCFMVGSAWRTWCTRARRSSLWRRCTSEMRWLLESRHSTSSGRQGRRIAAQQADTCMHLHQDLIAHLNAT